MHPGLNYLYPSETIEVEIMPMDIWGEDGTIEHKTKNSYSDFEKITEIIDYLTGLDNRILIFSGFNPLLHPEIIDICSYAKDMDFIVGLASGILIDEYNIPDSFGCDVDWIIMPDFSMNQIMKKSQLPIAERIDNLSLVREIIRDEDIGLHLYLGVNHFNASENLSYLSRTIDPDIMTLILYYDEYQRICPEKKYYLNESDLIKFMSKNKGLRLPNGLRPAIIYSDDPEQNVLRFKA